MRVTHTIRLRGPWDVTPLSALPGVTLPTATKMSIPCSWRSGGWPGFAGRARHVRRFGKPTGVGENERVLLVLDGIQGERKVQLNGEELRTFSSGSITIDVTALLQARNELLVEVKCDNDAGGICGDVALQICSAHAPA